MNALPTARAASVERDREVPPAFAARLSDVFPRVGRLPWLKARWEAGDPWQPIGRWVIWSLVDVSVFDEEFASVLLPELQGPSPRSEGHYCADGWCQCPTFVVGAGGVFETREKPNCWVGGLTQTIDYETWKVFQETGCYGRRFWIVQGSKGGVPRSYDGVERQIARMAGLPDAPPAIGDLPYAPLDERVIKQLVARDRLRDAKGIASERLTTSKHWQAEDEARARAAAAQVYEWLGERVAESADEAAHAMKQLYGGMILAPHGTPMPSLDKDAARESFINETALIAPSSR